MEILVFWLFILAAFTLMLRVFQSIQKVFQNMPTTQQQMPQSAHTPEAQKEAYKLTAEDKKQRLASKDQLPSLEPNRTSRLKKVDSLASDSSFEVYHQRKAHLSPYARELRVKKNLKKAFIFSMILERKY